MIFTHSLISVPLFHFIRLVSFCLLFLMATLQERITALEAKIEMYEAKLDAATTEAMEEKYVDLITERTKTLNALLQQLQQQQGEFVPVTSTSLL